MFDSIDTVNNWYNNQLGKKNLGRDNNNNDNKVGAHICLFSTDSNTFYSIPNDMTATVLTTRKCVTE